MAPLTGTERTAADPISGLVIPRPKRPALDPGPVAVAERVAAAPVVPSFNPAAIGEALLLEADDVGGASLRIQIISLVDSGDHDAARRVIDDWKALNP